MTPYRSPLPNSFAGVVLVLIGSITLGIITQAQSQSFDALTKTGFDHFYSLEYEQAVHDFQRALDANPDEPKAANHLLEATLFQELYRYNALDTRLYAKERFLTSKQIPVDGAAKAVVSAEGFSAALIETENEIAAAKIRTAMPTWLAEKRSPLEPSFTTIKTSPGGLIPAPPCRRFPVPASCESASFASA